MKLKDRKKMFKDARIARQTDIDQLLINISNQIVTQKSLLDDIKSFKKIYLKNISYNQKLFSELNKKKKKGYRVSSFSLPSNISEKLCTFLDVPLGTTVSRTDITKQITAYIRVHNLQINSNRRSFEPDDKLGSLLGPINSTDNEKGFTYFNLQRYISPHVYSIKSK